MRKVILAEGEYYHIYNRGTDKRNIFCDPDDLERFFESMVEFNVMNPIGSIFENSFRKHQLGSLASKQSPDHKLVDVIAYCLNPNHFHFLVRQVAEKGIEKFMHRLGTGYTKYFNNKYKRTGSLFQGTFKAVHIDSDAYLLHLSAYINLNHEVHQLGNLASKSSWEEYIGKQGANKPFCVKEMILGQFPDVQEYEHFARQSVEATLARRGMLDESSLLE